VPTNTQSLPPSPVLLWREVSQTSVRVDAGKDQKYRKAGRAPFSKAAPSEKSHRIVDAVV